MNYFSRHGPEKRLPPRLIRGALGLVACLWILTDASTAFAQSQCTPVARVFSAEGLVFVSAAPGVAPGVPPQLIPVSAGTQVDVCAGQAVQSGPRSTAAVLLLLSNQTIKLNQNTTVTILAEMPTGQRSVLDL